MKNIFGKSWNDVHCNDEFQYVCDGGQKFEINMLNESGWITGSATMDVQSALHPKCSSTSTSTCGASIIKGRGSVKISDTHAHANTHAHSRSNARAHAPT